MSRLRIWLLPSLLAACVAAGPAASIPPAPIEITILFTSDEHGWLLAHKEDGRVWGGAAELMNRWVGMEEHCPGPPSPPCRNPRTLALSGGDNYTGPALSSFFDGAPMAEVMARMGYSASAFGNHELDFGRAKFVENRAKSGMVYLAANLRATAALADLAVPPFVIFERRGIKIGVVGLATDTTLRVAMPSLFEGITFDKEEAALSRAVPQAWSAGADLVVLIAHECPDVLQPIVARHPEWRLSLVAAGHCHKVAVREAGTVPIIAPGWRLDHYLRVSVTADPRRPSGQRVTAIDSRLVDVSRVEDSPPAEPDVEIARVIAAYQPRLDAALGQEIGWAGADVERGSELLGRWIAGAWRDELHVDVALLNRKAIRQGLPKGAITKASVWSMLPFDDAIVLLEMKGSALARSLASGEAVSAGAVASHGQWILGGAPIDPARVYRVATIDFLYQGDHMDLKNAVGAEDTGIDWRDPVIDWTRKQRSTKESPLDLKSAQP